jgi:hypothetical protein
MARFATPEVQTDGLYRELAARAEKDLVDWLNPGWQTGRRECDYPRRRILEALRAGRTVNVPAGSLPAWALVGCPARPGHHPKSPVIRPQRAIVSPDDTIVWSDDDWARLFLEENDL